MEQRWQLEPKNRPDCKSILDALAPLRAAATKKHPVPEFWTLQQRLILISYVGYHCDKIHDNDPMAKLLEANHRR